MHQFVWFILFIMLAARTYAQDVDSQTLVTAPAPEIESVSPMKKWGGGIALESTSNLYKGGTPESQRELALSLAPSFIIQENLSLSAATIIGKPLTGPDKENTYLTDTRIILSKSNAFSVGFIKGDLMGSIVAPTSKDSRETDHLYGGVGLGVQLRVSHGRTDIAYRLRGDQYSHEYNLDEGGQVNNRYVLGNKAVIEYRMTDTLSIAVTGTFDSAWSYRNIVREKFSLSEDLTYYVSEKTSIYIGYTNEGRAFKANGRESNVEFTSETGATVRAGMSLKL